MEESNEAVHFQQRREEKIRTSEEETVFHFEFNTAPASNVNVFH